VNVATVPSASAAAMTTVESELITAMPGVVAHAFARVLPVSVVELPLELPAVVISQTWHPRSNRDPAHALLRTQVAATIRRATPRARGVPQPRDTVSHFALSSALALGLVLATRSRKRTLDGAPYGRTRESCSIWP
jgi:hypothetical protein